ncbi:MAG: ATP-binding protein [Rhodocyclaceae bacterium]|nr:ATP-binding protein [Rhodocyclaceae bacterium]
MAGTLCILGCHNFHREMAAAISAEGWSDVVALAFPARCGRPPVTWAELRPMLPADCAQVVLLGRACINALGEPPHGFPPVRVVRLEQCFHLVAGTQLVAEAIAGGAYLMTPVWLADWRKKFREMGFAPEQGAEFFGDFARELVLLDTGLDAKAQAHFEEIRQAVQLPARRVAVGLDHTRPLLARLVLEWRLERERQSARERDRRHARELADHVSAMDLLTRLTKIQHESDAITAIEELFRMLFAPEALHYLKMENRIAVPTEAVPDEVLASLQSFHDDYAWTSDGKGFLLRIGRGEDAVGRIAVLRLAFPEHRERYLNMALAMTGVCGLAIENARNRRKLLEAEKMASLGMLVAGVAHEINTPLGVGLTAASTLQAQTGTLARRFAERSMTQSDLDGFLARAGEEAGLIRTNLERIGRLVDSFRQVAVHGKPLEKRRFKLRECINEVIRSLGGALSQGDITINVLCDPGLEVESLPGDWASILINLISNSLKHGFKDRRDGAVNIEVASDADTVRLDYHDDGRGMEAETLARVFDPFFTTDLQHGMGLGMHLVYNLITQRLGGSIQCESRPGRGVHFHIEVPR